MSTISMTLGAVIFGIGAVLAAIGGLSFKLRAIANKPAWGGITTPFLIIGIIVTVIGLAMIILTGMANGQFK